MAPEQGNVFVFSGTTAEAEALTIMLNARGLDAVMTDAREIEGGTAVIEAQILVPPDQAEDARALIADVQTGNAAAT
jgi:hypothetical protein